MSNASPWPKFVEKLQSAWIQAILELNPKSKPALGMPRKLRSTGMPTEAQGSVWIALSPSIWIWLQTAEQNQLVEQILTRHLAQPAPENSLSAALIESRDQIQTGPFAELLAVQTILIEAQDSEKRWILGFTRKS